MEPQHVSQQKKSDSSVNTKIFLLSSAVGGDRFLNLQIALKNLRADVSSHAAQFKPWDLDDAQNLLDRLQSRLVDREMDARQLYEFSRFVIQTLFDYSTWLIVADPSDPQFFKTCDSLCDLLKETTEAIQATIEKAA